MPDTSDGPPGSPRPASRATHDNSSALPDNTPGNATSSTSTAPSDLPPPTSASSKSAASQSMADTSLPTSQPPLSSKDADPSSSTTGPSPYGTRSRNRTAGSRPNYAEDKEPEMEYEYTSNSKSAPPKDAPPTAQQGDGGRGSGMNTRRATAGTSATAQVAGDGAAAAAAAAPVSKSTVSQTSAQPAAPLTNGASTNPKKRKAGSAGLSSTSTPAAVLPTSTIQTTIRGPKPVTSIDDISNIMTFEKSKGRLEDGALKADDGTVLKEDDHVYLICEPPGEPYYLARIMEFLHKKNDPANPIDAVRVNWYYRPRDIQRKVTDSRVVFASMHSDTCPLTSLRGMCHIVHRAEVKDIDEYRKRRDSFWYEKMFDRYIHRYYEVIPTSQVINVPPHVKKVLDERWKYLIVEIGRGKELTSAVKLCKRCSQYCANNDSVGCAVCKSTYHMNCVSPPLQKKPSRGFAWACAPCSRAQEKKLEARNIPTVVAEAAEDGEDDEIAEELLEEDEANLPGSSAGRTPDAEDKTDSPRPATAEQLAHSKMWPYRYLGIHCKVEDALDYDDRIYPRASSRLGPRHQANINTWHGRPVEYVKPADIKRKYVKSGNNKKDTKLSKDTLAALEADKQAKEKRPKWVLDEPPGYVHRGEDKPNNSSENTAKLLFRLPEVGETSTRGEDDIAPLGGISEEQRETLIDKYMAQAKNIAPLIGVEDYCTNFLDKSLEILYANSFDAEKSLKKLRSLNRRKDLKEPEFTKDEVKRFEDGVTKFGSELHSVAKHVKTQSEADIVRFYYIWKKTDRGSQIWANFEGRKGKKEAKRQVDPSGSKLVDDVADDHDDSAFDNDKAHLQRRTFECKFCSTHRSRRWRRAPGVSPGTTVPADPNARGAAKEKGPRHVLALCHRCAELWRKYGIQWEEMEEVAKKVAQGGGKAWKRRIDEELLKELQATSEPESELPEIPLPTNGIINGDLPTTNGTSATGEPAKKKAKVATEKDRTLAPASSNIAPAPSKKKPAEKPERSPSPEMLKPRVLPCGICNEVEPIEHQHLTCRECRLSVHRRCYGVSDTRSSNKWICDTCANDKNLQISTVYKCLLCPVQHTNHDFVGPSKTLNKKKSADKDKDRDRADHERRVAAAEFYRQKQKEAQKPLDPRETLKRTTGNNWVHVICALYTPEIKIGRAQALEPVEGIGMIPMENFEWVCKLCKDPYGACVYCYHCRSPVHPTCAAKAGYTMGFFMSTVKNAKRDQSVTFRGKTGVMQQIISCKEHHDKGTSKFTETDVDGRTAMQIYIETYKQANLRMTGTVRKAQLLNEQTKANVRNGAILGLSRRTSLNGTASHAANADDDNISLRSDSQSGSSKGSHKACVSCKVDVSPKWWPLPAPSRPPMATWGVVHSKMDIDSESPSTGARIGVITNGTSHSSADSQQYQCHKCHHNDVPPPSSAPAVAPPQAAPVARTSVVASAPIPPLPQSHGQAQPPSFLAYPPANQQVTPLPLAQHWPLSPSRETWPIPPPAGQKSLSPPQQAPPLVKGVASQLNGVLHQPALHALPPAAASPPQPRPNGLPPQAAVQSQPPLGMSPPLRSPYLSTSRPVGTAPHHTPAPPPPYPQPASNPYQPQPAAFTTPSGSPRSQIPVAREGTVPPASSQHGSPRVSREQLGMGAGNSQRAPSEGRTPGGASESPSLRNLLH